MKFYRFLSDGRLQIGLVKITQKKRRPKKAQLPTRRQAVRAMRARGFFQTISQARAFVPRLLVDAVAEALRSMKVSA